MSDLPARLQQLFWEEISEDLKNSVDRLETFASTLPPAADDFRREVTIAAEDLRAYARKLVELIAAAEAQVGKKINADMAVATRNAINDFQVAAQRFIQGSIGASAAAELRPLLNDAYSAGREALEAAKREMSEARDALSIRAKGTLVLVLVVSLFASGFTFFIAWNIFAMPGIGVPDKAAVVRDGLFLEEVWPHLTPESRRELIKIHDTSVQMK